MGIVVIRRRRGKIKFLLLLDILIIRDQINYATLGNS